MKKLWFYKKSVTLLHSSLHSCALISSCLIINTFPPPHVFSVLTNLLLIFSSLCRSKTGFAIAINLMYGMASLSSTFALLLVTESSIKSKHVQKVSGVYLSNFWFSALVWDLVNFLLPCLLMLVSMTPDNETE